jgi:hypothetical protein
MCGGDGDGWRSRIENVRKAFRMCDFFLRSCGIEGVEEEEQDDEEEEGISMGCGPEEEEKRYFDGMRPAACNVALAQ